jgi:outer membrane receptor for ferrienterochelin and colicins
LRPAIAALALGLLVTPRAARADEDIYDEVPGDEGEDEDLEVVVTGTRTAETAGRAAVRTDIVTREEAARRGATNVGEALAGSVGLQVNPSAYGAIGAPSAIQIGGFDRERVLILEDGERVVGDVGGAVDLAQLSVTDVDRIEVVQGPSSSLYGTSAIGGVVNVITAPPEVEGWSGRAQAEGRYPWGGFVSGTSAFRSEGDWVSLDASSYASQGVALREGVPDTALPPTERYQVGVRAGTELSPAVTLDGRVRYGREQSDGIESQELPGLPPFIIDLPERTDRLSARLRSVLTLGPGHSLAISAGSQWFWNSSDRDRRGSPVDDERERFHMQRSIEATASAFQGRPVSFVAGARGETESFDQTLVRTSLSGTELEQVRLVEVTPTSITSGAGYGEVRLDPADSVTLLGGVRVEGNSRFGAVIAPRGGVAIRHLDWLLLRASGGRGYRAPSAKELGFVFDHSVFGYRVIGNEDLDPESSWGFVADVELRPTRGLRLRALGFANWIDDLIDLRIAPEQTGGGGVDDYTYVNVGRARTSGVQADVSVRATELLRVEAGYAYLFTRDEELVRPLPGRPPHTFSTALVGDLPFGMTLAARWRFVTSAYLTDELRAPGYSSLDLRYAKELWAGAEAYVGALNVLGSQKDPDLVGDQRPVEGRTVYLGLRANVPMPAP